MIKVAVRQRQAQAPQSLLAIALRLGSPFRRRRPAPASERPRECDWPFIVQQCRDPEDFHPRVFEQLPRDLEANLVDELLEPGVERTQAARERTPGHREQCCDLVGRRMTGQECATQDAAYLFREIVAMSHGKRVDLRLHQPTQFRTGIGQLVLQPIGRNTTA